MTINYSTVFAGISSSPRATSRLVKRADPARWLCSESAAADGAVTIPYTLTDGTAMEGVNYVGVGGTVSFADGQTTATITVLVLDDGVIGPTKSLTVMLGAPSIGLLSTTGPTTATLGITDDDATSSFNFSSSGGSSLGLGSFTAREDVGFATIVVTRTGDLSIPATVDYATGAGTATPGFNYFDTHGTLQFAAGAASATFQIQILDDGIIDTPGTVNITLSNPTGSIRR